MPNYSAGTADVEIRPNFQNFVRDLREDLDRVEAKLGVEINPDFTNFTRQLQDYLDLVQASLSVEINPDLANFATELNTELNRILAALDVEINPDTTNFATELGNKLNLIQAALDVEINPDTTGFEAALQTKLALIREAISIRVEVDQSSLDNLEALIRTKLAAMDLHVTVKVDADTASAANELAALKAAYRDMTMNVDADTTAAAAQIGALNGIPVTANVRADAGGLLSGLVSEPMLLNLGAVGLTQLPAAATAVASIGADVQALVQNAALLPGFFAAGAAAITTMAVGFDGFKDAFADGKKGQEAYQAMGVEGRQLVDVVKASGKEWDRIGARIQNITLDGLSEQTDRFLKTQMPALDRGMGLVAGSMNRGISTMLTELSSGKSIEAVDSVFANTATSADILNTAIKPIVSSIGTLADTGSDKLPRLSQGLADAATRLDGFLTRADQSGDLSRWMDEGIAAGGRLLSILGNLGSMLSSVLGASKVEGEGFLVTVDRLTERWAAWLKSAEGQASLIVFFREGREQLDGWKPILSDVGDLLVAVYGAAQAWSAILLPFLQAASSLVADHGDLVQVILVGYLAMRTIAPIFAMLQAGWAGATAAVGRYAGAQAAASAAGAGAFRSSIAGIAGMLGAGGIFGIAVAGAAIGLGLLATKHQEAAAAAEEQQRRLEALRETLDEQTGAVTQETISATTKDLENNGYLKRAQSLGIDPGQYVRAGLGLDDAGRNAINSRLQSIIMEQQGSAGRTWTDITANSGLNDADIAAALQGVPEAVTKYADAVAAANEKLAPSGMQLADLGQLKEALNDVGESAATLGGEMNGLETNTGRARESQLRINETLNGTFALTEDGKRRFQEFGLAVANVPNEKTVVVNAATEDQQRRLEELGYTVERLPDGTVKITLDDAAAKASIAQISQPVTKTVTVNLVAPQGSVPAEVLRNSKDLGYAAGGPIVGGVAGQDSVPIMAMPGEHMLTTSDVDKLGGQQGVYRFRAALQAGLVRPMKSGGAVGWSDQDEIDLQQAINAVDKAKQAREDLEWKKGADDSDRRGADLRIQELELKVRELEAQKAGGGANPGAQILPQVDMPGRRSNAELDKEDADAAVDQANTKRNKVYNTPGATEEEKAAADRDLIRAQNSREETYKRKATTGTDGEIPEISLPGIAASAAGILAEGFLSALGLENSILSGGNVYTRSLNKVLKFYGDKDAAAAGDAEPTGDYGYTPKNLPQDIDSSSSSSSSGTTEGTQSADSYDPGGGVEQWRPTFASVLRALSMPAEWLNLGLAQMRTESGGNPRAINNWDSNAAKGTPSKGLMQVIDPTFASNRSALYPNDIWDPGANIAASLQYTVRRYTSPVGVWGQGHGYKDGGWAFGPGGPRDDGFLAPLSNGEFVVNAAAAAVNAPALEAMNAGLPVPLPPLPAGMTPRGGDSHRTLNRNTVFNAPIQTTNPREFFRELDRQQSLDAQGPTAGLPR